MNLTARHDEPAGQRADGYAEFDSSPPPSTHRREHPITDIDIEVEDRTVITGMVITGEQLRAAEQELKVEYDLLKKPLPEHVTKNDSMDQPCPLCSMVAMRAVAMVIESGEDPN